MNRRSTDRPLSLLVPACLACSLTVAACGPGTDDQGSESGSSGSDSGSSGSDSGSSGSGSGSSGSDTGSGATTDDGGSPGETGEPSSGDSGVPTPGEGECEMYPSVDFMEEVGECFEGMEMTVVFWSSSGFRLESPADAVEVTWPQVAGYPTVMPAQGDSVVADFARCLGNSWSKYLRVSDTNGRLLWEGGGLWVGEGCDVECARLVYADRQSAEECEHHNGLVATPMSVQMTADETLILGAHESAEVTIFGEAYVVHSLTSEWQDADQCDDCQPIYASAYIARLQ